MHKAEAFWKESVHVAANNQPQLHGISSIHQPINQVRDIEIGTSLDVKSLTIDSLSPTTVKMREN